MMSSVFCCFAAEQKRREEFYLQRGEQDPCQWFVTEVAELKINSQNYSNGLFTLRNNLTKADYVLYTYLRVVHIATFNVEMFLLL